MALPFRTPGLNRLLLEAGQRLKQERERREAADRAKRFDIGGALLPSIAAVVAAPFTGGASLAALPTTLTTGIGREAIRSAGATAGWDPRTTQLAQMTGEQVFPQIGQQVGEYFDVPGYKEPSSLLQELVSGKTRTRRFQPSEYAPGVTSLGDITEGETPLTRERFFEIAKTRPELLKVATELKKTEKVLFPEEDEAKFDISRKDLIKYRGTHEFKDEPFKEGEPGSPVTIEGKVGTTYMRSKGPTEFEKTMETFKKEKARIGVETARKRLEELGKKEPTKFKIPKEEAYKDVTLTLPEVKGGWFRVGAKEEEKIKVPMTKSEQQAWAKTRINLSKLKEKGISKEQVLAVIDEDEDLSTINALARSRIKEYIKRTY